MNNLHQILAYFDVDVHRTNDLLTGDQVSRRDNRLEMIERMLVLQHFQHRELFVHAWITQTKLHQESIELSFGKGKSALVVNRVLSGDDQERRRQLVGRTVNRDAAFSHRFEQRRLSSRRGAVDFIRQHNLSENRAGAKLKFAGLLIEYRRPGYVGRQQIGRTLNSLELASNASRQRASEHRLCDTGNILQKKMAFAEPRDHGEDKLLPLADDRLFDIGDNGLGGFTDRCDLLICHSGRRPIVV